MLKSPRIINEGKILFMRSQSWSKKVGEKWAEEGNILEAHKH